VHRPTDEQAIAEPAILYCTSAVEPVAHKRGVLGCRASAEVFTNFLTSSIAATD